MSASLAERAARPLPCVHLFPDGSRCGARSVAFRPLRQGDPRLTPVKKAMRNKTWGEAWCREHLPPELWTRRRRWLYILRTAINHPVRLLTTIRAQRKTP